MFELLEATLIVNRHLELSFSHEGDMIADFWIHSSA